MYFRATVIQMKNRREKRTWYKLDNAAIMIPATTRGASTRVFRIVCELRENVDPEVLQQALDRTIWEFPHFNVVLRKGLFWYYLDSTNLMAKVMEDSLPPCASLYIPGRRTLLYRVVYFNRRISLEMYHVLADGTGAFIFFRRMIVHYLEMKYGIRVQDTIENSSAEEKTDDAFRHFYENAHFGKQLHSLKSQRAFRIKGEPDENFNNHLLEIRVSAKAFIALAHRYHVTAGELMCAMYIEAIIKEMTVRDRQFPIVISVPVNLRQYFPSETTRNFFSTIRISYNAAVYDGTIESILPYVHEGFGETLKKESIQQSMNAMAALEYNPILRVVPLVLKDIIIGSFARAAEKGISGTVSNLGRVTMPEECTPYIERFAAYMSKPDSQLCICSYQDEMIFGYCDGRRDHNVILQFVRILIAKGLDVNIASNDYDNKEDNHAIL